MLGIAIPDTGQRGPQINRLQSPECRRRAFLLLFIEVSLRVAIDPRRTEERKSRSRAASISRLERRAFKISPHGREKKARAPRRSACLGPVLSKIEIRNSAPTRPRHFAPQHRPAAMNE